MLVLRYSLDQDVDSTAGLGLEERSLMAWDKWTQGLAEGELLTLDSE